MKSKVILLVGPPLSGKDTYLRSQDYSDFTMISRDDILMSLHDTDDYSEAFGQVDQKEVDRLLNQKIQDCIDGKKNVIINMTNLTKRGRNRHLSKFPNSDYEKIAIVFPKLDITEYINRNLKRKNEENKFIPLNVIQSMIDNWEDVTSDEGFDQIIKLQS
jgi:predicted kinase